MKKERDKRMKIESKSNKCIFCGKTEAEFNKDNCWTEEHIIPKALGNESLKIFNVCKDCNSGLGTYIDSYFVNHVLLETIRQGLGLKGQSGKVPNAFKEGKDKDGNLIRIDKNYQPIVVPHIEENDNTVRIIASSKEEAKTMIKKKFSRMNFPEDKIREMLAKVDQTKSEFYKPTIRYDFTVEFNRFYLEAMKIAFEYAVYKLGDNYLEDSRAIEIRQYLKNAIDGKMKDECKNVSGVCCIQKEMEQALEIARNLNCHMIIMHTDVENKLIVEVILFGEPSVSFGVLISEDAGKFDIVTKPLIEIGAIKTNSTLNENKVRHSLQEKEHNI